MLLSFCYFIALLCRGSFLLSKLVIILSGNPYRIVFRFTILFKSVLYGVST